MSYLGGNEARHVSRLDVDTLAQLLLSRQVSILS